MKIRTALEKTWDYATPEKASEFKGLYFFIDLLVITVTVTFRVCLDEEILRISNFSI